MIDTVFDILMTFGGFLIGLIAGLVRRHGGLWTLADTMAAGICGFLLPVLLLNIGALPAMQDTIREASSRYSIIGGFFGGALFLSPILGAFLGLWLVRLLRGRAHDEAPSP